MDENIKLPVTESNEPEEVIKTNRRFLVLAFVKILVIIFCICTLFLYSNRDNSDKVIDTNTPEPIQQTTTPIVAKEEKTECVIEEEYVNQTKLNIVDRKNIEDNTEILFLNIAKTGSIESIVETDGDVLKYVADPFTRKIVYAVETQKVPEDQIINVYLYSADSKKTQHIFEKKTEYVEGEKNGYSIKVQDLSLSPDGTLVAITTPTEVFTYNLVTEELSKIISIPPKEPNRMGVYALDHPRFSQDNRYLLITEGYWEGSATKIFDIEKSEFLDVKYSGYVAGATVTGWYEDDLIIQRYGSYDWVGSPGYFFVSPADLDEDTKIYTTSEEESSAWGRLLGDNIYITSSKYAASGFYACNNVQTKYEVSSNISTLKRIDLQTSEATEILKWDITRSSGVESPPYLNKYLGIQNVNGREAIVVVFNDGSSDRIFSISDSAPFTLTELVF